MVRRVALDVDVLELLVDALNWRAGAAPDPESITTVRIYFYLTNPVVTPTVVTEAERANEPVRSSWKHYHFEEIRQDDFYRGCVKGMAERYIDYHPDPRDCRLVAEAECAKVQALLTVNDALIRGLSGRIEAITVARPSEYWNSAHVLRGTWPQNTPAEGTPLATASWWRW